MIKHTGAQLYTVRTLMNDEKSIFDVLCKIKSFGYDEIQTAGYSPQTGFYGLDAEKFASLAQNAGLSICGTICGFEHILDNPEQIMEDHAALGTKNIGLGCMPENAIKDTKELIKFTQDFNKLGEIFASKGFMLGYHNHSFEFRKSGNERIIDILVREFDPKNISFILDTYWVQHGGGDVCSWIEKLSGKIDILHLKDMAMEDVQMFAEIGNGNLDFDKIIKTAESCGVVHYVVEQDECNKPPLDSLKESCEYLKKYRD